MYLRITCIT